MVPYAEVLWASTEFMNLPGTHKFQKADRVFFYLRSGNGINTISPNASYCREGQVTVSEKGLGAYANFVISTIVWDPFGLG